MDVLGRDSAREAYRVAIGGPGSRVTGFVPDRVISDRMALTGGRGHQTAYDWIARHEAQIADALNALRAGRRPKPPFDRIELETS